jgi:site-specific DNA-methyltransferase (adenine-specific)
MMNLIKGDCLEQMKLIPSGSIDAIITDPPYGTTQCKWDSVIDFDLMWEQLNRIIKPNGAIVLFGSEPFSSALRMSNIKNYKYDWVWNKVNRFTNTLNVNRQPLRIYENISVFYGKQCVYNKQMRIGRSYKTTRTGKGYEGNSKYKVIEFGENRGFHNPKNIIDIKADNKKENGLHPTQKPIALMKYLIKTYTNENETVLDFTMGSGTTGVAAKNLNRGFIGIELDDKYFNIAKDRINEA